MKTKEEDGSTKKKKLDAREKRTTTKRIDVLHYRIANYHALLSKCKKEEEEEDERKGKSVPLQSARDPPQPLLFPHPHTSINTHT